MHRSFTQSTSLKFLLIFVGIFGWVMTTFAASYSLTTRLSQYTVGDQILVSIVAKSDTAVNAFSGTIKFPTDLVTITGISKSGSIVNLWAQEPNFSASQGIVTYEGVALNGYTGTGTVLNVMLKAKQAGTVQISFNGGTILANDGVGTNVLTLSQGKTLVINPQKPVDKPIVKPATSSEPQIIIVPDQDIIAPTVPDELPAPVSQSLFERFIAFWNTGIGIDIMLSLATILFFLVITGIMSYFWHIFFLGYRKKEESSDDDLRIERMEQVLLTLQKDLKAQLKLLKETKGKKLSKDAEKKLVRAIELDVEELEK